MEYLHSDDAAYMSDYVVHFTKAINAAPPERSAGHADAAPFLKFVAEVRRVQQSRAPGYFPWLDILGSGTLRAGQKPLGAGRKVPGVVDAHRVVCFSEIPPGMLTRLYERRKSLYGIGFLRATAVEKGAAPVWYLDNEGPQARVVKQLVAAQRASPNPADLLWKLTPFVDYPGTYGGTPYRFEWEREWRVVGDVHFDPHEVAFLFLPEAEHDSARGFLEEAERDNRGPNYTCALIDPRWPIEKVRSALPPSSPVAPAVPPWEPL